jgi:hypothetical protein
VWHTLLRRVGGAKHTILIVVYSCPQLADLRPQVPNLFRLADRAGFFVGDMLIHAFGGVAMGTAGVAGLDSVTLAAGSTLALPVMRYQWDALDGYGSVPTPRAI